MGDSIVADVKLTLAALLEHLDGTEREAPPAWPGPTRMEETDPLSGSVVMSILKEHLPENAVVVLESPSSTLALRNQLRISKPNSYFFGCGGGLGFGLSAAVGIQIAEPDRPVVCVLGEGSVQYAVAAFWTAAAYDAPVTFLVLRNEEYAILKWFAEVEQVAGSPGLDLPALESAKIAAGYGIESRTARSAGEVEAELAEALAAAEPRLVEVPVQPGMNLF
jgi:benzoylformate decarboxylase